MTSLDFVPREVILEIIHHLTAHDLTKLAQCCKRIDSIVEPLLWAQIELHGEGYHESLAELSDPPPFITAAQRQYHPPGDRFRRDEDARQRAKDLFSTLQHVRSHDEWRLIAITRRVRSLCTVVDSLEVWKLLPYFTNLEVVELHGAFVDGFLELQLQGPCLTHLRFAKLFGYVPRDVATWILRSSTALERLELGLLDRPISDHRIHDPEFPPLPEDKLGEDDDGNSDYGSLDDEFVIPRPLGGIFLDEDITFPALRVLHLCQPRGMDCYRRITEYSWSSRAETASLIDWRYLLLASSKLLETLVLQQRPGAEDIEGDSLNSVEFLQLDKTGVGSKELVEMLEGILFQDAAFPALRNVYLNGITVGQDADQNPSASVPGGRFMLRLKGRNIRCEARLGTWTRFHSIDGRARWTEWYEDVSEDDEDDEEENDNRVEMGCNTLLARV
ncbi:hypothetical protein B0J13DRAFT_665337 [Dactylonectria estremocensis]|uniref:F-box domain-containing protein n=1 Tax=Dactylonectria estremocensis TaxID=1079267 RepID=A0A9P9EX31_9HYPO|nr:hypothetical protein B0J13DRAFT_665337 [Dactylonectria estremocensis]